MAIGVALGAIGERIVDGALFIRSPKPEAGPALIADRNRIPSACGIVQPARDVVARVGDDGRVARGARRWPADASGRRRSRGAGRLGAEAMAMNRHERRRAEAQRRRANMRRFYEDIDSDIRRDGLGPWNARANLALA